MDTQAGSFRGCLPSYLQLISVNTVRQLKNNNNDENNDNDNDKNYECVLKKVWLVLLLNMV